MNKPEAKPYALDLAELFEVESDGDGFRYEIAVGLPLSYSQGSRSYPVVVVLDGNIFFATAVETTRLLALGGEIEEVIVVGVGTPRARGFGAHANRRMYDFSPTRYWRAEGPYAELNRKMWGQVGYDMESGKGLGGAEQFLMFLADQLLPLVQRSYRADLRRPALFGDSSGGAFVLYALFQERSPFRRYICGSPATATCNDELYRIEERYAATHADLDAAMFLAAGMDEMVSPVMEGGGIASGVTRFSGLLSLRQYPGFRLTSTLFDREVHVSVPPALLSRGLRVVFGPPKR